MKKNVDRAEAYYTAVAESNFAYMEKALHPDVQFVGPFGKLEGKGPVLEATKGYSANLKKLTIRAKFGSDDQAVLVYDFDTKEPGGEFPAAVLLTFKGDLIVKVEPFFDSRPFVKKAKEIFK